MFYERLKLLCTEKGIKLTNLIQELGMSSGNMNKWKNGVVPKGNTLSKLADYFNVSVDYLIGKTDEQTNTYHANNINSNFVQGDNSGSISIKNIEQKPKEIQQNDLSKEEIGILKVYRSLDIRDRAKFMNFVFDMEDKVTKA